MKLSRCLAFALRARAHWWALALLMCTPLAAQNTLTFTASTTTGDGSVVPSFTWSTSPAAASCNATGPAPWAGTKAASGTQTLPAITSSQTYNLECTWPGDSIVTFQWVNATQNTDSSAYTDRKFTRIRWTFNPTLATNAVCNSAGVTCVDVDDAPTTRPTMRTVTGIAQTGTLRALATHVNQRDVESAASNTTTKTFTGNVTVNRSVGITVNPVPGAPSTFSTQ